MTFQNNLINRVNRCPDCCLYDALQISWVLGVQYNSKPSLGLM